MDMLCANVIIERELMIIGDLLMQATLDISSLSEETELLSSAQASSELDDGWFSSMVAELLAPDDHLPSAIFTASPDQDSVFQYDSPFSRQHSQSKKRKRPSAAL